MKKGFYIYHDLKDQIKDLDSDEFKNLFIAIFDYSETKTEPTNLKPMAKMAFSFLKKEIDRQEEKYISVCERNKENGKKGGRPKEPTGLSNNPNNPLGYSETQITHWGPNNPVGANTNTNTNYNTNTNTNYKDNIKSVVATPQPTEPDKFEIKLNNLLQHNFFEHEDFKDAWDWWQKEKKGAKSTRAKISDLQSLFDLSIADAIKALNKSAGGRYKGLFIEKENKGYKTVKDQREDLIRELQNVKME